jgi:hypothetical protein
LPPIVNPTAGKKSGWHILPFATARAFSSVLTLFLFATVCFAKDASVIYELNPSLSETAMPAWLFYLGARETYRKEHHLSLPRSGEIVPSFDEEVTARTMALQMYVVLGSRDPYWETLTQVSAKAFLPAYVWTFHHRPEWPDKDRPKNLGAFEKWARSALKNHKPQTGGRLVVKK